MNDRYLTLPEPKINDRFCVIGPTGSGKTELVRALLKPMPNVIVIDPKHCFTWNEFAPRYMRTATHLRELLATLRELEDRNSDAPVIYRPPAEDLLPKNIGNLDQVYRIALERGHTHVYNDDFAFMTAGGANNFQDRIPYWMRTVTTGRQRGVGASASFYRAFGIPLFAMSESDIRIVFYMRMEEDRARAERLCGPIDWEYLGRHDHSFVWATDKNSSAPMRLRLGEPALANSA